MKKLTILFTAIAVSAYAGAKLQLQSEIHFTDTNGVAIVAAIASSEVGKNVKIYKTNKEYYTGIITSVTEDSTSLRVFGDILNVPNASFGFTLAKGGIFAGAVVEKDTNKTYVLELDSSYKGYILQLTNRYDKPSI